MKLATRTELRLDEKPFLNRKEDIIDRILKILKSFERKSRESEDPKITGSYQKGERYSEFNLSNCAWIVTCYYADKKPPQIVSDQRMVSLKCRRNDGTVSETGKITISSLREQLNSQCIELSQSI